MRLRLSVLRKEGIVALVLFAGTACRGEIMVQEGEGASGQATSTGSTAGAAPSTSSGSGGGGQGASSSGVAGGSDVDAGASSSASGGSHVDGGCDTDGGELDPSGYPDGGGPLPGTGYGCFWNLECPGDEFCWYPGWDNCGYPYPKIMVLGFCRKRPTECTNGGPEVCGCDGTWYCNECQANAAGYSAWTKWSGCPAGATP